MPADHGWMRTDCQVIRTSLLSYTAEHGPGYAQARSQVRPDTLGRTPARARQILPESLGADYADGRGFIICIINGIQRFYSEKIIREIRA